MILLTDNQIYPLPTQLTTAAITVVILLVTLLLLLLSAPIMRLLGRGGASILTRIMGMVLAALSVELILEALATRPWV